MDIPFTLRNEIGYTGVHNTIPVYQVNIQKTAPNRVCLKFYYQIILSDVANIYNTEKLLFAYGY